MKLIFICIVFLWLLLSNDLSSQTEEPFHKEKINLSTNDVHYLYNKAFDLALKDGRDSMEMRTIFYTSDYKKYDTILITIDPILSRTAFSIQHIDEISNYPFNDSLDIQLKFNEISIINFGKIIFKHFDSDPILKDDHLLHVTFSDIYINDGYYYVGVLIRHQLESGYRITYPNWVIFKLEWCNNKFILFRKIYEPWGTDGMHNHSYSRQLEDCGCY